MIPVPLFIALLAAFLVVFLVLLAFTIISPARWARFVDWEHEFFLKRGLVSSAVSRGLKRMEKGFVIKIALAGTIMVVLMDLTVYIMRYVFGLRI